MDIFRSGNVWHYLGADKILSESFVAGEWLRLGVNSHVTCSYAVTGTVPDRVEFIVELQSKITLDSFSTDSQSYVSGGLYNVSDKSYRAPASIGIHSISIMLQTWSIWRLKARRVGGDETTRLYVTALTASPDT